MKKWTVTWVDKESRLEKPEVWTDLVDAPDAESAKAASKAEYDRRLAEFLSYGFTADGLPNTITGCHEASADEIAQWAYDHCLEEV